jgi:hypothetical protein
VAGGGDMSRGVAAFWLGVAMLALWFIAIREPPNDQAEAPAPSTTTLPAYVEYPGLLVHSCVRFPYPDDDWPDDRNVYVWVTDLQVKPCDDLLDYQVAEVNSPEQGCGILADLAVHLMGPGYTDPPKGVLCLRWWRPGRA